MLYQRAMRPRRELLRASFRGTSFGGAWHSTGKIEVEFKLPWLQVETPLLGARRPIIVQPMLDEGEVETLDARGGDRSAESGGAMGEGAAAAKSGGSGGHEQHGKWGASASNAVLPPALVDVLSARPTVWVTLVSAPGQSLSSEVLHLEFVGFLLREMEVMFETSLLPEIIAFGLTVLKGWDSFGIGSAVLSATARDASAHLSIAHCEQLLAVLSAPDDRLIVDEEQEVSRERAATAARAEMSGLASARASKKIKKEALRRAKAEQKAKSKGSAGAIASRIYIETMNLHPIALHLTVSSNSSSKNAAARCVFCCFFFFSVSVSFSHLPPSLPFSLSDTPRCSPSTVPSTHCSHQSAQGSRSSDRC